MFEEFFHLRENPFSLAPNPRFIFHSHEHSEALAHLRYWVENGEGFVLITGEVGTGKTTALFDLLAQLPTDYAVAFVANSTLTIRELLEEICRRFGVEIPPTVTKPALLGLLERFLVARADRHLGSLLILDEAQNFESEALEEIRLLSNLERRDGKLIQIALVGQPELERKLGRPELRQLRQRIGIRYRLGPLTEEETSQYLQHRVAIAGGDAASIFPLESARAVHRLTHGIPREINIVASQALINAFVAGAARVLPEHVQAVVDEFAWSSIFGDEIPPPRARLRPPAAPPLTGPGGLPPRPATPAPVPPRAEPPRPEAPRPEPPRPEAPLPEPPRPPRQAPVAARGGAPVAPGGAAPGEVPPIRRRTGIGDGPPVDGERERRPALGVVIGGGTERARPEGAPGVEPSAGSGAGAEARGAAPRGAERAPGPIRGDEGGGRTMSPAEPAWIDSLTDAPARRRFPLRWIAVLAIACAAIAVLLWQWERLAPLPAGEQPAVEQHGGEEDVLGGDAVGAGISDQEPIIAPGSGDPSQRGAGGAGSPATLAGRDQVAGAGGRSQGAESGEYMIQMESYLGNGRTEEIRSLWIELTASRVLILPAELDGSLWHRVLVGTYTTREEATAALAAFHDAGIARDDAMVVRYRVAEAGAPGRD